ncbi:Uncharacterized conserved protein YbcV, DUF1398 family [Siphonobacter aquaeclarae]|uniref:Uncharacterized conserved protein YbcV, DUF1398 family n=2 Tax=Siphonobacter aquaeclarae TaxID=563176 RepID=A0A1G9RRF3_9BACT|nr:Uncharacterized conserved protein YbcV, DUF1398 family [Siphonobacter aquaeclarae]
MNMFTIPQIDEAHARVRSGADFPAYVQAIKALGVTGFETWVTDSHTDYHGAGGFQTSSGSQYSPLVIAKATDAEAFLHSLKIHQQGRTDYLTFCRHCAETGIERWVVSLEAMTCTYFDTRGETILVEQIPG